MFALIDLSVLIVYTVRYCLEEVEKTYKIFGNHCRNLGAIGFALRLNQ